MCDIYTNKSLYIYIIVQIAQFIICKYMMMNCAFIQLWISKANILTSIKSQDIMPALKA